MEIVIVRLFNEIPIPTCRDQPEMIIWVLASPIFDSILPLKNKLFTNEIIQSFVFFVRMIISVG